MFARGFRSPGGFPGGRGNGYPMRGPGFAPHPFFPGGGILAALVVLVVLGVVVFALWRVFRKAGFDGAWSLFALVPFIGAPVALLFLALADWPVIARLRAEPTVAEERVIVPTAPLAPSYAPPADLAPTTPMEAPPAETERGPEER